MKILHLSDIHMGSGFSHGKINPETQINTRLEDFVKSLRTCIDQAIDQSVDLVLFGGDAFPDSTPPPYVHSAFATQFRRLADAQIATVFLIGNHDQHTHGQGGASLSIYRTLAVPHFIVGDSLTTHRINTPQGMVQVTTLPWLNRSNLLTRPETEGLSLTGINELLLKKLEPVLEAEIRQLDPNIPSILLAHVMVDRATYGAERSLAITNKGFQIPLVFLNRPEYDYVALGHVHRHQNLNPSNDPPVVYPGSIERVDFSEEKEDKGYVMINIIDKQVNWTFHTLSTRPFKTIKVDITKSQDVQGDILKAIKSQNIKDAVVRLIYTLRPEQMDLVSTKVLHDALKEAHTYNIKPDLITHKSLQRMPELGVGGHLDPLTALEMYLNAQDELKDISKDILKAAQTLLMEK